MNNLSILPKSHLMPNIRVSSFSLFVCIVSIVCLSALAMAQTPEKKQQSPFLLPLTNPKAREQSYLSALEILAKREFEREHNIHFPRLTRGNPKRKELALTFDDGPHPIYTQKLLAILKQFNVKATFFVVGMMVDKYPDLVGQEVAEGHEVANHTYHHLRLPLLPDVNIEEELSNGANAIERAVGSSTRLFRPPGGEYDNDVIAITKRLGYVMVLWTDDPADFANPGSAVIEKRTLQNITNGGILLLHDGVHQTLDILPDLLMRLKKQGYKFVTCSQMATERGIITTGGPRIDPPPAKKLP